MNNDKNELLKQVNIDIIFFFLLVVKAIISFYLINEKKKSILNIPSISNEKAVFLLLLIRSITFMLFIYLGGQMYIKNSYVCLPNMLIVYVV